MWRNQAEKGRSFVCLLRFTMADRYYGQSEVKSASEEGREPNCKLRSSNASMDCKRKEKRCRGAAHTPEVRSGRSRVDVCCRTDNSSSF